MTGDSFRTKLKDWLEITAIIIAACWAFYTFYYEHISSPQKLPSFLTINSQITKVSENQNFEAYKITISLANKSKSKESILASWFEINGFKLLIDTSISDTAYANRISSNGDSFYRYPRYFAENLDSYKVIHYGRLLAEGTWINPDQEITQEFTTLIPKGKFEIMRLMFHAVTAKQEKNLRVYWSVDSIGTTSAGLILNNRDTITVNDIQSKDSKYLEYIKNADMSYTFNENEYSLGLINTQRKHKNIINSRGRSHVISSKAP